MMWVGRLLLTLQFNILVPSSPRPYYLKMWPICCPQMSITIHQHTSH